MIKICSFFSLPIESERIDSVYSIANSAPAGVSGIKDTVSCLVPKWSDVRSLKTGRITEDEFVARYRSLVVERWTAIKKWLDSLSDRDIYLCCWEREGFCHRYLVAKLIKKFRPDLEVRAT